MAVTVSKLRDYLNLPADVSDDDLALWLNAAKSEAAAAGVPEFQNNAQYDLFILSLASWDYDNRGLQPSGAYQQTAVENMQKMKYAFVLQLRYASEDPEVDPPVNPDDPTDPDDPADPDDPTDPDDGAEEGGDSG